MEHARCRQRHGTDVDGPGYSAQDAPGERYDVYVIDYGAYVDLISTQNAPAGMLPVEESDGSDGYVEVPTQDLRALRRAVLNFEEFQDEQQSTLL